MLSRRFPVRLCHYMYTMFNKLRRWGRAYTCPRQGRGQVITRWAVIITGTSDACGWFNTLPLPQPLKPAPSVERYGRRSCSQQNWSTVELVDHTYDSRLAYRRTFTTRQSTVNACSQPPNCSSVHCIARSVHPLLHNSRSYQTHRPLDHGTTRREHE